MGWDGLCEGNWLRRKGTTKACMETQFNEDLKPGSSMSCMHYNI